MLVMLKLKYRERWQSISLNRRWLGSGKKIFTDNGSGGRLYLGKEIHRCGLTPAYQLALSDLFAKGPSSLLDFDLVTTMLPAEGCVSCKETVRLCLEDMKVKVAQIPDFKDFLT